MTGGPHDTASETAARPDARPVFCCRYSLCGYGRQVQFVKIDKDPDADAPRIFLSARGFLAAHTESVRFF